jgi:UTP--glucose-1-phosphate uridylyltransferase
MKIQRVTTAIFPVGGLGTRFLPATKAMPKEMLPVVDKPLIQYAVEEARAAGIKEIIFVTGRGKSAIEDHFDLSLELDQVLRNRDREDLIEELHAIAGPPDPLPICASRRLSALAMLFGQLVTWLATGHLPFCWQTTLFMRRHHV